MEKTIDENKVIKRSRGWSIIAYIRYDEFPAMPPPCVFYIRPVPIQANVFAVIEVGSIGSGTAPDIKDSSACTEIIVFAYRNEFLFRKGCLPKTVGRYVIHDTSSEDFHSRHLAVNLPRSSE